MNSYLFLNYLQELGDEEDPGDEEDDEWMENET